MLALVGRAQARLELSPKPDVDDAKMKPAMVPKIEPGTELSVPAVSEELNPENVRPVSEEQNSISDKESALHSEPEKISVAPSAVTTPTDEERDFPL